VAAWPDSVEALVREQEQLAAAKAPPWQAPDDEPALGGCFICFPRGLSGRGAVGDRCWSAAIVVQRGRIVSSAVCEQQAPAPYETGLLALREGPALEAAVRGLSRRPDTLIVNATGRDHPRRAGLALHLGAVLDLPTVGVTQRPLLAEGAWPRNEREATSPLVIDGDQVGCWVRTRRGRHPLAVDSAWRTDVDSAVRIVLDATAHSRTPEPLRQARRLARIARAQAGRR
jgi:deoxyribonuclease V